MALTCHSSLDVIFFLSGLSAGAFCVSSWTSDRDSIAKRLGGLRLCQQSLLGRLSSEEEDDIISDGAEQSCVFQMRNVRWRALGFDIAVSCVAHCCSVLSLSPIKDELQQYGEGCDGRHVQVSQ